MDVVQLLISADRVHIGVQTVADGEAIALQGLTLPLSQGMDNLGILTHRRHIKGNRALHAAEVIVQTGIFGNKQGSGHTLQIQRPGKFLLEHLLDMGNGPLGIVSIQSGLVALGNVDLVHIASTFLNSIILYIFLRKSSKKILDLHGAAPLPANSHLHLFFTVIK